MGRSPPLLTRKVCLITGATAGIGLATAREVARRGFRVVLVGLSEERASEAVRQIARETGSDSVDVLLADLSVQEEVRRLATTFARCYDRLDVLVNNVGAVFLRRVETADGIERTFALNHLSPFLLTNLLLDRLKASAPARIVNVSSGSHRAARIDFDDLQGRKRYNALAAYGQSKLANVLFTYELARRLAGSGVTANVLHPGVVATTIGHNNGPLVALVMRLIHLRALSPEEGAETSVYLATSPEVEGVSGRYFEQKQPVRSSEASYDVAVARRLWQVSAELCGLSERSN